MKYKITEFLHSTTEQLAKYLDELMPKLYENWWKDGVLDELSFHQQQWVEQHEINSLFSLDLAALLRVLDHNWYQISKNKKLTKADRHFVKEMQTIRNRWAHTDAKGFSTDDIYRDLDTLQRFAAVIESDDVFIQDIHDAKRSLAVKELIPANQHEENPTQKQEEITKDFQRGQIVYLKSNPSIRGPIISIILGYPENRYEVFVDNEQQIFYKSQIKVEDEENSGFLKISAQRFHAHLTALQIRHPGLSTLHSLNAARIDFVPYQFRPVIKFVRADRPRLLIADSVGVGKTIEAGLILRELQARRDIRSVLIICPRALVVERKWQLEMKRFEEHFTHLDGGQLRYCVNEHDLDGLWPEQYKKIIVSYSLFNENTLYGNENNNQKYQKGLLGLDPPPQFDLVIVDEAHHIRNTDTYRHQAVRYFCNHAEAAVFLTATPIQLGNEDLCVLLNTLRPDLIIDEESFEHMAEPNSFINCAIDNVRSRKSNWVIESKKCLDAAVMTKWGQSLLKNNPKFKQIQAKLTQGEFTAAERVQLIKTLESLHTFAGLISRTRRRDIGNFTIRKSYAKTVKFTRAQRQLHDNILDIQAEIFARLHGESSVKFMLTTIRRQVASCLYGLRPFLQNILNRHINELYWDEVDNTQTFPDKGTVKSLEAQINTILEQAKNLDPYDPKFDAFKTILNDKQKLQNNKVMTFSSFRHTLYYLNRRLIKDGFRVGMVHGGIADEERLELRRRFELAREQSNALDIMLFSEIGAEGLDYQFCDCIVNYDIPWNPMRIEQRIGRIDRIGQKSESITIFNLITPGTVDAEIYNRCLVRIGVFERALGGNERILGEISREIRDIAENFSLSEEEQKEKLQQLSDNKIRLMQEQEELEQNQVELFGFRLPKEQIKKEVDEVTSYWLAPTSIERLISLYLKNKHRKNQEYILGKKQLKTLRLSQEVRNQILVDFQRLPRQRTLLYRNWENWLKGSNPHLQITFDSTCASRHREAAFIMPVHPLVKQAANAFDTSKRVLTYLYLESNIVPPGHFPFAIYQWKFHGIRENLELHPISISKAITTHMKEFLEKAKEDKYKDKNIISSSTWDELDKKHYDVWAKARKQHRRKTKELAQYRRESLATSHEARISLLKEQLHQVQNQSIRRMRQSQINTAESDYSRRIHELDSAIKKADITAQPVAYGILTIREVDKNE